MTDSIETKIARIDQAVFGTGGCVDYIKSHRGTHENELKFRHELIQNVVQGELKVFIQQGEYFKEALLRLEKAQETTNNNLEKIEQGFQDYKNYFNGQNTAVKAEVQKIAKVAGVGSIVKQIAALVVLGVTVALTSKAGDNNGRETTNSKYGIKAEAGHMPPGSD